MPSSVLQVLSMALQVTLWLHQRDLSRLPQGLWFLHQIDSVAVRLY
jgi:hypothetical protein